jgi:FkbM family methyltransferase
MKYLRAKNVVVTAGANCGLHTRFFSKLFHVVYAFEPAPLNFHCMVNNSQFNNVIKMQCALGKEHKPIRMEYVDRLNVGMHKVVDVPEENIIPIIPMITLDCLNIPACDLIQLDVEHYEYNVLVGAKNTIEKYKPVISVEVHTSGEGDEEVLQFLKDINYVRVDQSHADAIFVPNL